MVSNNYQICLKKGKQRRFLMSKKLEFLFNAPFGNFRDLFLLYFFILDHFSHLSFSYFSGGV